MSNTTAMIDCDRDLHESESKCLPAQAGEWSKPACNILAVVYLDRNPISATAIFLPCCLWMSCLLLVQFPDVLKAHTSSTVPRTM